MQNSSKKGFTLIEMSLVLLVIGILAGIVLRNIGGQSAVARDTKRIGDLRIVASYLISYMGKHGHFPTSSSWSDLERVLSESGVTDKLPQDPSGRNYNYYYCTDKKVDDGIPPSDVNHFILRAELEQSPTSAPKLWENSLATTTWNCKSGDSNVTISQECNSNNRYFCLGQ